MVAPPRASPPSPSLRWGSSPSHNKSSDEPPRSSFVRAALTRSLAPGGVRASPPRAFSTGAGGRPTSSRSPLLRWGLLPPSRSPRGPPSRSPCRFLSFLVPRAVGDPRLAPGEVFICVAATSVYSWRFFRRPLWHLPTPSRPPSLHAVRLASGRAGSSGPVVALGAGVPFS